VAVDGQTNEITQFALLLEPLGLAGCVVTADALHAQRDHVEFLVKDRSGRAADQAHFCSVRRNGTRSTTAC
jgi:predicted transposase YbfD/YdcC